MTFRKLNQAKPSAASNEAPPKVGRPSHYQESFCQQAMALGAIGYSKAEIIKAIAAGSRNTSDAWEEANPEYREAMARARDLALAWWEAQARKHVDSRDFNAHLYKIVVSARFPDHGYKQDLIVQQAAQGLPVDLSALSVAERASLEAMLQKAKAAAQAARASQVLPNAEKSDLAAAKTAEPRRSVN